MKELRNQIRIIGFETGIFLLAQLIALFVGIRLLSFGAREAAMIQSTGAGVGMFVGALALSTIFIILLIKFFNSRFIFQLIFAWLIFIGSLTVFEVTIGEPLAMTFAVLLVVLRFLKPVVLLQNIAMVIAIGGIAPQLAMFFSTPTLIVVLIVASFYDYIAVFKTKHMVKLFEGLVKHNIPFTLVIPDKGSLFQKMHSGIHRSSERGREFYLLGTGDVAFPAVFAISVLADFGPMASLLVVIGSLIGLLFDHYLLMKLQRPIPALPTIAAFSLLGFAAYFIGVI